MADRFDANECILVGRFFVPGQAVWKCSQLSVGHRIPLFIKFVDHLCRQSNLTVQDMANDENFVARQRFMNIASILRFQ